MNTSVASRFGDRALASRIALAGALAVALIIVALHAVKPELEPSWRFISEYATGPHGWIMKLVFLIWSASCVALALAVRREVQTLLGRTGVVMLLIVAGALVLLYGQIPSRIVELTIDSVATTETDTYLVLRNQPVLLPPPHPLVPRARFRTIPNDIVTTDAGVFLYYVRRDIYNQQDSTHIVRVTP